MPFKQSKSNIQRSSKNQFYFPMLIGTLSFLQKYLFLLLSFQFVLFTVLVVKNVQVTSKLSPQNHFITKHILFLKQFHQLSCCNVVYCVEVVENVDRRTKMKIDSTWTSVLRPIGVDLMSVFS